MEKVKMIFESKDYISRQDIESAILSAVGGNSDKNREALHEIQGTEEELRKLFLSDISTIFGVKVVCDKPTYEKVKKKK